MRDKYLMEERTYLTPPPIPPTHSLMRDLLYVEAWVDDELLSRLTLSLSLTSGALSGHSALLFLHSAMEWVYICRLVYFHFKFIWV